MATILDKDLIRETSVLIDGREIVITLTEGQEIFMKLKGMKSGGVRIGIGELYNQLNDNNEGEMDERGHGVSGMISIDEIRHNMMITNMEYETKVKLENFLVKLKTRDKERIEG